MKEHSERRGSPRSNRPHTGATRTRNGLLAIALVSAVVLLANGAWAAETITVEVGTDRGAPGEVIPKGTHPAEAGAQCIATLTYTNNEPDFSEHPDTDILVGPIEFRDVERGPGITFDPQTFTATGPVRLAVRLGGDGITSGGFTVGVTCRPPTTTTSTSVAPNPSPSSTTTSTTPSVTTPTTPLPAPPTTLSPPPVGGPPAGGGDCVAGACEPVGVATGYGAPVESPWWLDNAVLILGVAFVAALVLIGAATLAAFPDDGE